LEAVLSDLSNENTWDGIFAPKNLLNPNNGLKNVFSNEFYENESIKLNNEQIIKILNNPIYINNSPMIGSSSNGSTSPNHHWTYHNLDEFF
jgi:hypothetical protein